MNIKSSKAFTGYTYVDGNPKSSTGSNYVDGNPKHNHTSHMEEKQDAISLYCVICDNNGVFWSFVLGAQSNDSGLVDHMNPVYLNGSYTSPRYVTTI